MNDLRERLEELAEDNYREFSKKLTPTKYPILGVRTPKLREFAKSVPVGEIENYLRLKPKTFEDVLLRGFLIGRLPYKEMLEWFDSQVEYIDNWATCDMFCSALRQAIKKQLPEFLDLKVKKLLEDKHEFTIKITGEEWETAQDKAFQKRNKNAKIDGFRPGKLQKMFLLNTMEKKAYTLMQRIVYYKWLMEK